MALRFVVGRNIAVTYTPVNSGGERVPKKTFSSTDIRKSFASYKSFESYSEALRYAIDRKVEFSPQLPHSQTMLPCIALLDDSYNESFIYRVQLLHGKIHHVDFPNYEPGDLTYKQRFDDTIRQVWNDNIKSLKDPGVNATRALFEYYHKNKKNKKSKIAKQIVKYIRDKEPSASDLHNYLEWVIVERVRGQSMQKINEKENKPAGLFDKILSFSSIHLSNLSSLPQEEQVRLEPIF